MKTSCMVVMVRIFSPGQLGYDTLYGEQGNDILHGGYHNDILDGGPGNDVLVGWGGMGMNTILSQAWR